MVTMKPTIQALAVSPGDVIWEPGWSTPMLVDTVWDAFLTGHMAIQGRRWEIASRGWWAGPKPAVITRAGTFEFQDWADDAVWPRPRSV